jgi:riboflavin biosynthesis pyrimidine reductase
LRADVEMHGGMSVFPLSTNVIICFSLGRSLDLPLESQVFDTTQAPTMVLADQSAWVTNYQSTSMQDGKAMEHRLQARGVDVVMLEDLSLEQVLSVCYLQGAYSVLLDSRGPDLSGLENFLGQHAVREDVVNKLVVNISPVLLGENRTGPGFRLGDDLLKLERVSTRVSGRDVIIEGYFPN